MGKTIETRTMSLVDPGRTIRICLADRPDHQHRIQSAIARHFEVPLLDVYSDEQGYYYIVGNPEAVARLQITEMTLEPIELD